MPDAPSPFFEVATIEGVLVITIHADHLSTEGLDELYKVASVASETETELPRRVVVDLSPNRSLNSRMIAVLIKLQKQVLDSGGTLRLCGIVPQVRKLLDITRASALFPIFETRQQAIH